MTVFPATAESTSVEAFRTKQESADSSNCQWGHIVLQYCNCNSNSTEASPAAKAFKQKKPKWQVAILNAFYFSRKPLTRLSLLLTYTQACILVNVCMHNQQYNWFALFADVQVTPFMSTTSIDPLKVMLLNISLTSYFALYALTKSSSLCNAQLASQMDSCRLGRVRLLWFYFCGPVTAQYVPLYTMAQQCKLKPWTCKLKLNSSHLPFVNCQLSI